MSATWIVVLIVGVFTISFKAAGPVLLAGRQLPARLTSAFELLGPSLLAALVVTQSVGGKDGIVLDARLVGLGAARGRDQAPRAADRGRRRGRANDCARPRAVRRRTTAARPRSTRA